MPHARAVCLVLIVGLTLAGCIGAGDPAPGIEDPGQGPEGQVSTWDAAANALASPFAFNVLVDPEGTGTEPMLGVAPDGTLYTYSRRPSADGVQAGAMTVYASRDGGITWASVGSPVPFSYDPDLVVDAQGTVWFDTYVVPTRCNSVAVLRAGQTDWTLNPHVCNGAAIDRPRIVPLGEGAAYLYHVSSAVPGVMGILKTTDHGVTWTPIAHRLPDNVADGFGSGGFVNPVSGAVFLQHLQFRYDNVFGNVAGSLVAGTPVAVPGYTMTTDGGLTWQRQALPGIEWTEENAGQVGGTGFTDGASDDHGNVFMVWADGASGTSTIRLMHSPDDGKTWGPPVVVDASATSKMMPNVVARGDGRVAVAYYEADEPGRPEAVSAQARWGVKVAWTEDATAATPTFQSANLSVAPNHQGPVCTHAATDARACGERQLGDFFDLQAMPDGRVAAVWASTTAVPGSTPTVFGVSRDVLLQ